MTNSETSLTKPSLIIPKCLIVAFLILSFLGFLDALYLTVSHYYGLFLKCFIGECETVLESQYATIAGIPVALLGTIYYLAIFIFVILFLDVKKDFFIKSAAWLTIVGFLSSLYFIFLQLFIIKATCFYCLISAGFSIILFILGISVLKILKNKEHSAIIR